MVRKVHPTIYDVAHKAEVSISTVSRVLNAPELVTPATRERVLATIAELNFVPHAHAQRRRESGRIGVLAPFFTYPSFVQRLQGVNAILETTQFELVIYNVNTAARRDAYFTTLPLSHRLDGLIIMALPFDERAAERMLNSDLEAVLIEDTHPLFCSIAIDNEAGGRLAANYLIARGHRRCAFIGDGLVPKYTLFSSVQRMRGYQRELHENGLALPDQYIALTHHDVGCAKKQAHHLLSLSEPPAAIFAASDTHAIGVVQAARERGIPIPDALAVIGFDDLDVAEYVGLTTIRQPLEESGRIAVELLLARLSDQVRSVQHIRLPLTVVQRQTA